jgi:8-oxo-dGTP diphosphatase/2-hydroxy-dATP diphosphatase
MIKKLTLCIIHDHKRVLLGMKKRGFGMGRWNGFGGKVESGETIKAAAKRELWEEAGIKVARLDKIGEVEFEFKGDPVILQVHIFKAEKFEGQLAESDEMNPKWFNHDEIPFDQMLDIGYRYYLQVGNLTVSSSLKDRIKFWIIVSN